MTAGCRTSSTSRTVAPLLMPAERTACGVPRHIGGLGATLLVLPLLLSLGCAHGLSVATQPPGADVSVAGRDLGKTPVAISVQTLKDTGQDGVVRLVIAKPGYHPIDLVVPDAPLHDHVTIGLSPFRDHGPGAVAAEVASEAPPEAAPGAKPEDADEPPDEQRIPISPASFEADLALLLRYQGRLLLGDPVTPLRLEPWQRLYPASGGPSFLEGLRAYQEGRLDDARRLLQDAVARDNRDIDYRTVAGSAAAPVAAPGG